jgi:hypothetical protein
MLNPIAVAEEVPTVADRVASGCVVVGTVGFRDGVA